MQNKTATRRAGQATRPRQRYTGNVRARVEFKTVAKYAALTLIGFAMFYAAAVYATAERGCRAVGGEALFLLLPVVWYALSTIIRDTIRDVWTVLNGELPDWDDE